MKNIQKRLISVFCALALVLGVVSPAMATTQSVTNQQIEAFGTSLYQTVTKPEVGSIGGEWAVVGLARSGIAIPPSYFSDYLGRVESYVKAHQGKLHDKKYTEYSRLIVALSALGVDARNVAGYDLTYALGDYDKTIWQGLNGPIWALIALDTRDYPMPNNQEAKTKATRQMYIDRILSCQLPDGGWSLFGGTAAASEGDKVADADITAMALQALAKYQDQPKVKTATQQALACMSKQQRADGGFSSWGTPNSESSAQMLVALCELGISIQDARFVKNGKTVLDDLLSYAEGDKGFRHTKDGTINQMATEQGFYALVDVYRTQNGKNSLYRMQDVSAKQGGTESASKPKTALSSDIHVPSVQNAQINLTDIQGNKAEKAIVALASRGILNGYKDHTFLPNATMTRAEFSATVVRALGLPQATTTVFEDVPQNAWFAPVVDTAYQNGIIKGTAMHQFTPHGTITREQAGVMLARTAKLLGLEVSLTTAEVRDILAPFTDYTKVAPWAREALAFCYQNKMLDESADKILPQEAITRSEIAHMIYTLLHVAHQI